MLPIVVGRWCNPRAQRDDATSCRIRASSRSEGCARDTGCAALAFPQGTARGVGSRTMATLLDELFRYVGFGPEDGARLIAASAALTPAFDSIVDRFYVAIDANPEARAVFKDEAQIARQKQLLRSWLVRFFAGPYDDSYYEERARIGRAHVRIGLPQRYVFVSMNVIRSGLIEAVAAAGGERWLGCGGAPAVHPPAVRRRAGHHAGDLPGGLRPRAPDGGAAGHAGAVRRDAGPRDA
jgi:hypothetical protein